MFHQLQPLSFDEIFDLCVNGNPAHVRQDPHVI